MKKVLLTLIALIAATSMIFAATGSTSGALEKGTTNDSATFTYSLKLGNTTGTDEEEVDNPTTNIYRIGFSDAAVSTVGDAVTDVSSQNLKVSENFDASLASDLYIYWKIQSPVGCTISLTSTAMSGATNSELLHVNIYTEAAGTGTTGTVYMSATSSDPFNTGNGDGTEKDETARTSVLLTYDPATVANGQVAGSQKVSLTTDTFEGLSADTYSGTLTLTIAAAN